MTSNATCPHPPDGVLACGCTDDVVDRLYKRAGLTPPDHGRTGSWATVAAHLEQHLGPFRGALHDPGLDDLSVDVLVHAPSSDRPSIDLVTAGMSSKRMRLPRALRRRGHPSRAELVLRLRPEWASDGGVYRTLLSRDGAWALQWLQCIARLPHRFGSFLGDVPGLPAELRALPFIALPGCPFDAVLVADPRRFGRPLPVLKRHATMQTRDAVRFLSVIPIFSSELNFAYDRGAPQLFRALAAAGVDDIVRLDRSPVV